MDLMIYSVASVRWGVGFTQKSQSGTHLWPWFLQRRNRRIVYSGPAVMGLKRAERKKGRRERGRGREVRGREEERERGSRAPLELLSVLTQASRKPH